MKRNIMNQPFDDHNYMVTYLRYCAVRGIDARPSKVTDLFGRTLYQIWVARGRHYKPCYTPAEVEATVQEILRCAPTPPRPQSTPR